MLPRIILSRIVTALCILASVELLCGTFWRMICSFFRIMCNWLNEFWFLAANCNYRWFLHYSRLRNSKLPPLESLFSHDIHEILQPNQKVSAQTDHWLILLQRISWTYEILNRDINWPPRSNTSRLIFWDYLKWDRTPDGEKYRKGDSQCDIDYQTMKFPQQKFSGRIKSKI